MMTGDAKLIQEQSCQMPAATASDLFKGYETDRATTESREEQILSEERYACFRDLKSENSSIKRDHST